MGNCFGKVYGNLVVDLRENLTLPVQCSDGDQREETQLVPGVGLGDFINIRELREDVLPFPVQCTEPSEFKRAGS